MAQGQEIQLLEPYQVGPSHSGSGLYNILFIGEAKLFRINQSYYRRLPSKHINRYNYLQNIQTEIMTNII